jgi:hypothetical protein
VKAYPATPLKRKSKKRIKNWLYAIPNTLIIQKDFGVLLEKHLPSAKIIDKELKHVEKKIPEWYEIEMR